MPVWKVGNRLSRYMSGKQQRNGMRGELSRMTGRVAVLLVNFRARKSVCSKTLEGFQLTRGKA